MSLPPVTQTHRTGVPDTSADDSRWSRVPAARRPTIDLTRYLRTRYGRTKHCTHYYVTTVLNENVRGNGGRFVFGRGARGHRHDETARGREIAISVGLLSDGEGCAETTNLRTFRTGRNRARSDRRHVSREYIRSERPCPTFVRRCSRNGVQVTFLSIR